MLKGILTKDEICNERAPILWFPPHLAAVAAQAKMRSLELHPSLPHVWLGSKRFAVYLAFWHILTGNFIGSGTTETDTAIIQAAGAAGNWLHSLCHDAGSRILLDILVDINVIFLLNKFYQ